MLYQQQQQASQQRYAGALGYPLKLNDELTRQRGLLQPLPQIQPRQHLDLKELKNFGLEESKVTKPSKEFVRKVRVKV